MQQVKIANRVIGDGQPVFVIAEMAWSHDGSVEKAKNIIKGTSEAGADAISMHITSLKEYMVKDYGSAAGRGVSAGKEQETIYNYLNRVNLKDNDWKELFRFAKNLGLAICAMPNDTRSLRLCVKLKPDAYTIAAACFTEEDFVSEVAHQKKPMILRTGGATLGEIESAVDLIKKCGNQDIILLHGFQSYPTRIEETRLRLIPSLKSIFGLPVGLADHIDAESSLAFVVPLVALALGANVIEKHMTHNRKLKGEDFESAFNPDELKKFVEQVREIEKSFGPYSFQTLSAEEQRYRQVCRKRMVAARTIKKGAKITKQDIVFKRSDDGIYPEESKFIIGLTAAQDIQEDGPVIWDKVLQGGK